MKLSEPVILASTSKWRQQIFNQVGIDAELAEPLVDEEALKADLRRENPKISAKELALSLTKAKALTVSTAHPEAYVIAGDQTCFCDGKTFDKPKDKDEAFENIKFMTGKNAVLNTGICIFHQGQEVWSTVDQPKFKLRHLSDEEIRAYIDQDPYALTTCASFTYESQGIHLFDKIEGCHFSICGVPILPLSAKLRDLGILSY